VILWQRTCQQIEQHLLKVISSFGNTHGRRDPVSSPNLTCRIWKLPLLYIRGGSLESTSAVDCLIWRVASALQSTTRRDSGYSRDVEEGKTRTVLVLREKAAATGRRLLVLQKSRTSWDVYQNAKRKRYIAIRKCGRPRYDVDERLTPSPRKTSSHGSTRKQLHSEPLIMKA
jgi:hypothetical protein